MVPSGGDSRSSQANARHLGFMGSLSRRDSQPILRNFAGFVSLKKDEIWVLNMAADDLLLAASNPSS
ncbi:unnamed protein product [Linum trigynum]|uniref:Uncharacterized protein n=1 Tax=Linum trigynum TaxID=586398 RepID=A0AAV2F8Z7_9ROSI